MKYETLEEYIARGGKIERVKEDPRPLEEIATTVKPSGWISDRNGNPIRRSTPYQGNGA